MTAEVAGAVGRYARRFHAAVGDRHHVGSPLGAWLLLALCGPASDGATRAELAEVLGMDPAAAAAAVTAMLERPHPLVGSATAVWHRAGSDTAALREWGGALPAATRTGPLPDQAALDRWAREHSLGLIDSFPLRLSPATVMVLASALATRVSWKVPFDVAPAAALGPGGGWGGRLVRVLRGAARGHRGFIAATERAGDVIVHSVDAGAAYATPGLSVVSVAAAPEVAAADVLAVAHEIAPTVLGGDPAGRRSLFDLPLGTTPLWTISEEAVRTHALDRREERHRAVLPCWSARNDHDLSAAGLGFALATRAVAPLLGMTGLEFEARQTTMARYSRYGFEAAAVTGFGSVLSAPSPGVARLAELRFGHPYAVVAVASDPRHGSVPGPWHGIPVFSGWVSEPEDVPAAEAGPAELTPR